MCELARSDCRVAELVERLGEPQNLISYHLRRLREAGLVRASRSSFDARDRYYHLDLDRCARELAASGVALHPALRSLQEAAGDESPPAGAGRSVLFICTGNSARSPMAAAILRLHSAGRIAATSAGTHPKASLHPLAVRVLRERYGIDIGGQSPRPLEAVVGQRFDHVVTLCDRAREELGPFRHHPRRTHWSIPDPAAVGDPQASYAAFEHTAAEIERRIRYVLPQVAAS